MSQKMLRNQTCAMFMYDEEKYYLTRAQEKVRKMSEKGTFPDSTRPEGSNIFNKLQPIA